MKLSIRLRNCFSVPRSAIKFDFKRKRFPRYRLPGEPAAAKIFRAKGSIMPEEFNQRLDNKRFNPGGLQSSRSVSTGRYMAITVVFAVGASNQARIAKGKFFWKTCLQLGWDSSNPFLISFDNWLTEPSSTLPSTYYFY